MSADFKVGKYYLYNDDEGRTEATATIHAFDYVDGELYAVLTYYIDVIKQVRALPVEKNENGLTVIYLGHGYYLNSDAPVLPKPIKFQVGKSYMYRTASGCCESYTVTTKYTDNGITFIVLDNKYVTSVGEIGVDDDVVEYVDFLNIKLFANKTLKEIEE